MNASNTARPPLPIAYGPLIQGYGPVNRNTT
jgi:hypothetical protein